MRRITVALAAVLLLSLTAQAQDTPQSPPAPNAPAAAVGPLTRAGDTVALDEARSDMAFVSGGEVRISAQISDDIIAAGGEIQVRGASADHLIIAGGEIEVTPLAIHDVFAAGGRIQLSGPVVDDFVAFGGDVALEPEARIGGSTVLAGGRVRVEAPIAHTLMASGGTLDVNASIGGDATLSGDEVRIGPNARISGDLRVRATKLVIDPAAVISGRTIREQPAGHDRAAGAAFVGLVAFAALSFLVGGLLLTGAIAAALPALVTGGDQRLRTQTLPTLGVGALILLVGPVLIGALFATIVGAPLALFLLAAYLTALPVAYAMVAFWLGQAVRGRLARKSAETPPRAGARFGWTLFGGFALAILCLIPLLGALVWLAAIIAGVGATAVQGAQLLAPKEAA